jgi:hypothetical protein
MEGSRCGHSADMLSRSEMDIFVGISRTLYLDIEKVLMPDEYYIYIYISNWI